MSNTITISVFGTPRPGGSKRAFVYKNKMGVHRAAVTDDNPKSVDWKACVAHEAAMVMRGREPTTGALRVDVLFYMTRPKGHYGKKGLRPSAPKYHTTKPDATKLWRSTEDALTGIVWKDDSKIVVQTVAKVFADGRASGVEIKVTEAQP